MYKLLEVLKKEGFLTADEFISIQKTCRSLQENQVRVLRSLNILTQNQIQAVFAKVFQTETVEQKTLDTISSNDAHLVPREIALGLSIFPLGVEKRLWKTLPTQASSTNETLKIAMEDPTDMGTVEKLKFFLERHITPVCATAEQIAKGLQKIYGIHPNDSSLQTLLEKSRGTHPFKANIGAQVEFIEMQSDIKKLQNSENSQNAQNFEHKALQSTIEDEIDAEIARRIAAAIGTNDTQNSKTQNLHETSEQNTLQAAVLDTESLTQLSNTVATLLPQILMIATLTDCLQFVNSKLSACFWKFSASSNSREIICEFSSVNDFAKCEQVWNISKENIGMYNLKTNQEPIHFNIVFPLIKILLKKQKTLT